MLTGVVDYERYGLPDMDVCIGRFEGRSMELGPRVVSDPRRSFNGVRGGFEEFWSIGDREAPILRAIFSWQLARVYA